MAAWVRPGSGAMKLLVGEDDPLIQRSLREMVEAWGHACDAAADGEQAWEMVRQCPHDLILLDLNPPRLDGLAFRRRLRAAGGEQPMVLMLTARDTNRHKVVGLDQGAVDSMVQPFDPMWCGPGCKRCRAGRAAS